MNAVLACSRCGHTDMIDVDFLFEIPVEANRLGWSLQTVEQGSGRLVSADLCPTCVHKDSHPFAASAGAAETSLPFHMYPGARPGQTTASMEQLGGVSSSEHESTRLCTARGASRANAPELATPQPSESQPAQGRLHAPGPADEPCGHHTATPQDHPPTQPAPRVAPGLSCLWGRE